MLGTETNCSTDAHAFGLRLNEMRFIGMNLRAMQASSHAQSSNSDTTWESSEKPCSLRCCSSISTASPRTLKQWHFLSDWVWSSSCISLPQWPVVPACDGRSLLVEEFGVFESLTRTDGTADAEQFGIAGHFVAELTHVAQDRLDVSQQDCE
jgi:hypothetical protein